MHTTIDLELASYVLTDKHNLSCIFAASEEAL